MASRRSPDSIALELLNTVAESGEATKWDLIKVLGNETQFRKWIENFFLSRAKKLSHPIFGRSI